MDFGKPPGCRQSTISRECISHTTASRHNTGCGEEETDKGKAMSGY